MFPTILKKILIAALLLKKLLFNQSLQCKNSNEMIQNICNVNKILTNVTFCAIKL